MKVTHEKLLEYMLKTDFQPILVNFWCGNLGGGGAKAYILKSVGGGGGRGPPGPHGSSAYDYCTAYPRSYIILCPGGEDRGSEGQVRIIMVLQ